MPKKTLFSSEKRLSAPFLAASFLAVPIAETSRPKNALAGQKLASGIFCDFATETRPATLPQVTETHQENATYNYNFASGFAVYLFNQVATAQRNASPRVTVKPIRSSFDYDANYRGGAYTVFGFEVTENNGEIIIQPITKTTIEGDLQNSSNQVLRDLVLKDEYDHINDFSSYINGRLNNDLPLLTGNATIMGSVDRALIIQQNLVSRADAVARASGAFWDTPRNGQADQYHTIYRQTATKPPQPTAAQIQSYRDRVYGRTP